MGEYDLTLGVLLVGILFNTYMFGIVTVQFLAYYERGFKDPWGIRLAVATLLITDIVHSVSLVYMAWGYFVTNFNYPAIIKVALWPYTLTPILTAIAAIITHIFLIYRIYRLTKWRWLVVIFLICAAVSFSAGVAAGIRAWIIREMSKFPVLNSLVTCWLAIQMILDIAIASVMSRVLWKSRTSDKKANNVIYRLILYAIQIGIFSTIFACGDLISFLVSPETNVFGMFAIPLGRIYSNTLMHTLNVRGELQQILGETIELTTGQPSSTSFNKTKSIQFHVYDTKITQANEIDEFVHPQREGPSRRGGHNLDALDVGLELPIHETHSINSEMDFADSKHRPDQFVTSVPSRTQ